MLILEVYLTRLVKTHVAGATGLPLQNSPDVRLVIFETSII